MLHALQVGIEAEDAAIVYPEAFPDGVPALHQRFAERKVKGRAIIKVGGDLPYGK
jgi:hypothetical protein